MKIFIPFIFLCEKKIVDNTKLLELINKIKNYEESHNVKIFFGNYFNENKSIKKYYQDICIKCGIIYNIDSCDIKIINYNNILMIDSYALKSN